MTDEERLGRSTKIVVGRVLVGDDDPRMSTAEDPKRYFLTSQSLRESLKTPQLLSGDGNNTLKQRISSLENAMEIQIRRDEVTYQNILALSKDSERIEKDIMSSLDTKSSSLEDSLRIFKQEVHHRFDLQNAENKRLQQHITTLRSENHQLQQELTRVTDKLKKIEEEFGGDLA